MPGYKRQSKRRQSRRRVLVNDIKMPSQKMIIKRRQSSKIKRSKKERGIILPLYFGYGLKIVLVKLSSDTLNLTSRIFKKHWQEAVALILLVAIVASGFLLRQTEPTSAATYNWVQTDWSGGATTTTAVHPINQTGWTYYSSKDAGIVDSTTLTLGDATTTNFTEDFSTATYKDSASTTANWDTSSQNVTLNFTGGEGPTLAGSYDTDGHANDVAISGDYAYVADYDNGLAVIDISDPTHPTLAGSCDTAGYAYGVAISGDYAYVADYGNGLVVIDISDPTNPTLAGSYDTDGNAYGVAISGDYAYVADDVNSLVVIDISDPAHPTFAGSYNIAGNAKGVAISGDYAYVAHYNNGLVVVDISDPTHPTLVGSYDTDGQAYGVAISGDYTYVADEINGLVVVDISDPTNPSLAGSYNTAGYAYEVAISGDYAYVANEGNGLVVVDISDPTNPTFAGSYNTAGYAYGVAISGDYAYVADYANGLVILKIMEPVLPPTLAGSYNPGSYANGVAISGDYAYVADGDNGLVVIDISDPTTPTFAGSYDPGFACGVTISGDYAYVAVGDNGLAVVDISDPTSPTLAGSSNTADDAQGVAISGDYAYVADDNNGLVVIDISNPTNPTLAGSYDTAGVALGVAISGDYAYVADEGNGLAVINISNPTSPTLAGSYDTDYLDTGVAISGDYAYVADDYGLVVVDISDPTNPIFAGSYNIDGWAVDVAISGDYAYVAAGGNGLVVIDISDPTNPTLAGSYDTGYAYGVAISGDYAYVADNENGLVIVRVFQNKSVKTYDSSSIAQSFTIDSISGNIYKATLTATSTTPANTGITYYLSPDGGTNWEQVTSGAEHTFSNSGSDLRWKAVLTTSDSSVTPTLSDISIVYRQHYVSSSTLTSTYYNASDAANALGGISWSENLPTSTNIKFQIRTAPDVSGSPDAWTDWCGPDDGDSSTTTCSTSTYFTDPSGGEAMDEMFTDGLNDQWIQYKVWLETSDGVYTPTLSDVTLTYVVNAPPEFNPDYPSAGEGGVSASQNSDGTVTINYSIRDPDTDEGTANPGYVTPSFEYWNGSSWSTCTTMASGDTDNKAVATSTYNTYTATWYAKTDFDNQFMNNTAKIRVTIDDNEAANHTASQESAVFTLDTKDPALGTPPISVDASQNPALITLQATDDSSLQMKIGLQSNLSDASWQTYNSTATLSLATDPDTVYVQFKDAYNNTSTIASATTPETPTALMIQDTSNMLLDLPEYRLFIAWKKTENLPSASFLRYNILRSDDEGNTYSKIAEVTDQNTNYYADNTVSSDALYYYKVTAEDENHNISFLSSAVYGKANGTQDSGEGGGGSDTTAPVISNVATSTITTNSVTITWDTDELSNSTVGYSTAPGDFTNEVGVATMLNNSSGVGQHSVTLTGLTPNTTYYFQVKSTDPSGNTVTSTPDANGYTFTTLPGPGVVQGSVVIEKVTNYTAKISWQTDKPSNSYVYFATSTTILENSPTIQGTDDSTTNHSVTITGLTEGRKYYFYVKSTDSDGNTAYDKNVVDGVIEYYTFTTGQDTTLPVISDVYSSVSTSTAVITWKTNELANSRVDYGITTSYGNTVTSSDLTIDHIINLSDLDPSITYHYRVISTDANNNTATSTDYTFTTQPPDDTVPPSITNVTVSSIDLTSAIITWNTNENSNSIVDYGETTSLGQMAGNLDDSTTTHSVTLTNLNASTTYYFQVRSQDLAGNTATDDNSGNYYSFTTQKDTAPPTISNVSVPVADRNSATITWLTDEPATSKVEYATGSDLSNSTTTSEVTDLRKEHSVIISNLLSETTYYYRVISKDSSGNLATSSIYSFTTKSAKEDSTPPTIFNVATSSLSQTSVTISWQTDELSNSIVDYGTTISLGLLAGNFEESTTSHSVTLTGLTASTTCYFQVRSQDASGNTTTDDNSGNYYTFTTLKDTAPPNITSGPTASVVSDTKATIVWTTDELSTSQVLYGPSISYDSQTTEDTTLTYQHSVTITGLTKKTTYHYQVISKDAAGNSTSSQDNTFTTTDEPGIVETIRIGGGGVIIREVIPEGYKTEKEWCEEIDLYWYNNACHKTPEVLPAVPEEEKGLVEKAIDILTKLSNPHSVASVSEALEESAQRVVGPPLIAGEYPLVETGPDWARITWVTDKKSNSLVAYASEDEYQPTKKEPYVIVSGDPDEMVTTHIVELTGLKPSTLYHFQVRSKGKIGDWAKSDDKDFTTLSEKPEIKELKFTSIKETEANLSWLTTLPTRTKIEITNTKTGEKETREDKSYLREHTYVLENLQIATDYILQITAQDEKGNETTSSILPFSTSVSKNPPIISNVRITAALIPGRIERVQAIISWKTDKPSTSRIYYQEGIATKKELALSTPLDKKLVTDHILITTAFKPGKVYQFKVESIDSFNNRTLSKPYTILTPQPKQSVVDLIIKNFEETFGFLKRLKF